MMDTAWNLIAFQAAGSRLFLSMSGRYILLLEPEKSWLWFDCAQKFKFNNGF